MSEIRFEYDAESLSLLNYKLNKLGTQMNPALKNAINITARKARTDLKTTARQVYSVKASPLSSASRLSSASNNNLQATIHVTGGVLSLTNFKTSFPKRGAKASVKGSSLKELVGSKGIRAFKGPGGQIYQRKDSDRLPIKKLSGPSVPNMYREDGEVYKKVEPTIQTNLRNNVEAQVKKYLAKL